MSVPYFYTWQAQGREPAKEIAGGEGAILRMADGSEWLDMGSLSYQANLGLSHAGVTEALRQQASSLALAPPNADFPAKRELAAELLKLAPPGFSKVFFTLGGAEANENAMKIAKLVLGRHKFLSRYRSYHGATMGALALTGDYRRPPLEPVLSGVVHVIGDNADLLEETMQLEGPESIAAVFMEPIPGANGVCIPPAGYWKRLRQLCDMHGTLLVADAVLTGFGRTGRCFAVEHEEVVPDMITLAKGLTAGYAPLGAVLVHDRVAKHFDSEGVYAGLTNYAHPLGCAAGLAAVRAYKEEGLYARSARLESLMLAELAKISSQHPKVASKARGRGLLGALDIAGDASFWERFVGEPAAQRVIVHAAERRGTAIVAPALNMPEEQMLEGFRRIGAALGNAVDGSNEHEDG